MRADKTLRRLLGVVVVLCLVPAAVGAQQAADNVRILPGPSLSVAFTADGKLLASGGQGGEVRVWDVATGTSVLAIPGKERVEGVAISPDGKQIAFATEEAVTLVDAATGRAIRTWKAAHPVVFSRDGTSLIFGDKGASGTIKVCETAQAKPRDLKGHHNPIAAIALSRDGQLLASGGNDNTAKVWSLAKGAVLHDFSAGNAGGMLPLWVGSVAFSPDGRTIAYAAIITEAAPGRPGAFLVKGAKIVLRDVQNGVEIGTIAAHRDPIRALAFSPDGRTLVSSGDKTVKVWNVPGGELRRELPVDTNALEFSPDGSVLACATGTGVHLVPGSTLQ